MLLLLRCGNLLEDWCEECVDYRVFSRIYDGDTKLGQGFLGNFTILLFHYDGRTTEWDEFEWSKQAIHMSVRKQTKWWYAKRFLHPDIVAPYDYILIWDQRKWVFEVL
ncbi:hypothetical protein GmHk_03G007493 [Glycine max]|nr:hypothetical protein GmHk_03G007493 [Glycine max]